MLSRERKAELVARCHLLRGSAFQRSIMHDLTEVLAELIEAMPEEGCGEADLNWAIRPIRPPAPISGEELPYEAVCANCGCYRGAHEDDDGELICPRPGTRFAPPVAASPTGVGEESTAG